MLYSEDIFSLSINSPIPLSLPQATKIKINPNEDIDVQRLFYKKEILNIMNIE